MRVVLAAWGTRGDVQPFVCLGRKLADNGHDVELLVSPSGGGMVRAAGLPFRTLPPDWRALLRAEPGQRMLKARYNAAFMRWLRAEEANCAGELHRALIEGTESTDLIVCGGGLIGRCRAIADARGIETLPVHLTPIIPSWSYVSAYMPQRNLGGLFNRLSHSMGNLIYWRTQREGLAALHRDLGLPMPSWSSFKRDHWKAPCLLAYSQVLFPMPSDWLPTPAYPVGFLGPWPELREELGESGIPGELDTWLDAGPPPVFFGFGSMPVLDERVMLPVIRKALAALGLRGILAAGESKLRASGDEALYVVDEVDHQSLLPRCAAAVHHGGSGTTASSVGAGTPTLVCSIHADQAFWGERCRKLGVGDTLPLTKLNLRRLRDGLRSVLHPEVAVRAREVARRMAEEGDVANAVARIEGVAPAPQAARSQPERAPSLEGM